MGNKSDEDEDDDIPYNDVAGENIESANHDNTVSTWGSSIENICSTS